MQTIPLFPLGRALFPGGVLALRVFEVRYLDMVRRCLADGTGFGVVPLLAGREVRTPQGEERLADHGCMARIVESATPMPGLVHLRCVGTTRFRLVDAELGKYGLWSGTAEPLEDDPACPVPPGMQSAADALGRLIAGMQRDGVSPEVMPVAPPFLLDDAAWVANRWCELLPIGGAEQARLLAIDDPLARLDEIARVLGRYDAPG